ncbi:MAG TPA: hypothetical protein PKL77_08505 [Candidatus Omnitrophota bacterium]|nr:hypothetical protein [Candidatus Omnitrophota bacterium]
MKYKYPEAAEELKRLGDWLNTASHMLARIEELEKAKYNYGGYSLSLVPGGKSHEEDKIGSLIAKCETVSAEYATLYGKCIPLLAALDALPQDERITLDLCFVRRAYGWETRAASALHLSVSRIYQIKDNALRRYAGIRGYKE